MTNRSLRGDRPAYRFILPLACALGVLNGSAARAEAVYDTDRVTLELFGILDVGVGYLAHSYSGSDLLASTINPYNLNASPNSFTGMYSGGASMSRIGLRGESEFGTGQKVFFRVESAINVTSGNLSNNGQAIYDNINRLQTANSASAINGQLFSRASYLGVSDPAFGSLEAGRTTNFALEQVARFDPLQAALLYSPLGYSGGIGGGLGATENSRLDNSLKYENRYESKLSGLDFGAQYKFKGGQNSQSAGYAWVAMLGYENGPLSVRGTLSETTNSVSWPVQYSNVVAPDALVQVENTKGYMVTAMYKAGSATAKAGYESLTVWAPSNRHLDVQDYFGIILPKPSQNAAGEQLFEVFWIGGDYHFTPKFSLSVGFYDIDTYNSPEAGKAYWAQAYSLLADYTFTQRFDVYLGVMVMEYSGLGLDKHSPADAYSSNGMYGVGMRFRF